MIFGFYRWNLLEFGSNATTNQGILAIPWLTSLLAFYCSFCFALVLENKRGSLAFGLWWLGATFPFNLIVTG